MAARAWVPFFPPGHGLLNGQHLNDMFTAAESMSAIDVSGAAKISGVLTVAGGIVNSGTNTKTLTTVAAAGATLGNATAIPVTAAVVVVTVTASTEGVKLPTAATGRTVLILADPSVGNKVYAAAAGQKIGAATTATTAYVLAKNTSTQFIAANATTWRIDKGS